MSAWDLLVQQRKWLWRTGWLCFGIGLVSAVVSFFAPDVRLGATIFTLLGIQAVSLSQATQRIADLQAALDMKRMVFEPDPASNVIVIRPGEIYAFKRPPNGSVMLRAHTTSKLEVLK